MRNPNKFFGDNYVNLLFHQFLIDHAIDPDVRAESQVLVKQAEHNIALAKADPKFNSMQAELDIVTIKSSRNAFIAELQDILTSKPN